MLARLQQTTTLGLIAFALTWASVAFWNGKPALAATGPLLSLFGYAAVLAAEFTLLSCAHGADPAPKATARDLARAWWAEVRATPRVFCWQQPFRSTLRPDMLPVDSSQSGAGVLLIHGFACNRGFWNAWIERLTAAGVATVAANLEPVFGTIDNYKPIIEDAVRRLELSTGRPPLVVAHSMGGLAFRRWYADEANADRVARVITIGTPHHGTWLARFAFTANGKEMRRGSPWLLALAGREAPERRARFTCFYSHCDNIVFPPSTATLAGADNRHVRAAAHVDLASHPEPWHALQALLQHELLSISATPR